jgi:hypothetical protein
MPSKGAAGSLWPHYVSILILLVSILTAGLRVALLGLPAMVFWVSTLIIVTRQIGLTLTTVIRCSIEGDG